MKRFFNIFLVSLVVLVSMFGFYNIAHAEVIRNSNRNKTPSAIVTIPKTTTVKNNSGINSSKTCTVTFMANGKVFATRTCVQGGSVSSPGTPVKSGYVFAGWDKSLTNINSSMAVNARWTNDIYTVTFKSEGRIVSTQKVSKGSSATAPDVSRNGYVFDGWDRSFNNVVSDITVNAKWKVQNTDKNVDSNKNTSSGISGLRRVTSSELGSDYYYIHPVNNTGMYLDVFNNYRSSGIYVQLCYSTGADAQVYRFTHLGDNVFKIETGVNNGWTVLDVAGGSRGGGIMSYEYNGNNNQKWNVYRDSYGNYVFESLATKQVMGTDSSVSGSRLKTYDYTGNNLQKFILRKADKKPSWNARFENSGSIRRYFPSGGGKYYTGWQSISGNTYFFDRSTGGMTTGMKRFTTSDGESKAHWSYFGTDGVLYKNRWFQYHEDGVAAYKDLRYADSKGWIESSDWDTDGKFNVAGSRATYYVTSRGGVYKVMYEDYTQVNQRAYYNGKTNYGMACGPASVLMASMMTVGNGFDYAKTDSSWQTYLKNIWGNVNTGKTGTSGTSLEAQVNAARKLGMNSKGWFVSDTKSKVFNESVIARNLFTGYVVETLGYYKIAGGAKAEHYIIINGFEINSKGWTRIHTVDPYGTSNAQTAKQTNGINFGWRDWMTDYSADISPSVYNRYSYYALPIGKAYTALPI